MFLGKTLNSQSASLHPDVQVGASCFMLGAGITLRWTSIPTRGEKYAKSLHAEETDHIDSVRATITNNYEFKINSDLRDQTEPREVFFSQNC